MDGRSHEAQRLRQAYDDQRRRAGILPGTREMSLSTGMHVESLKAFETALGSVPAGRRGVVTEVNVDTSMVKVDLGTNIGERQLTFEAAARLLGPIVDRDAMLDPMRESIASMAELQRTVTVGDRVVDGQGRQHVVERVGNMGMDLYLEDEHHVQSQVLTQMVSRIDENTPFPFYEGLGSVPMQPGSRVRITGLDPVLNTYRTHGTGPMDSAGYVGQVGILEYAFYPLQLDGQGIRMYRVLLDRGSRRDFADSEFVVEPAATY